MERAGRQPNTLEEHIIKTFIPDSGMATDFAVYTTTISRTKTFSQTKTLAADIKGRHHGQYLEKTRKGPECSCRR